MSTVAERLASVIGNRSKSEFARLCGVPESSVRQWLDGKSLPSSEKLMAIAEATGMSIDWLLLGRGSKSYANAPDESAEHRETVSVLRFRGVASAGFGAWNGDAVSFESQAIPSWVMERVGLKPATTRALTASGISMLPTIGDGDLLLVDMSKDRCIPIEGSIYVLSIDDSLFVKRLRRAPSGWIMVSDNRPLFSEEPVPPGSSVKIHGLVVWVDRKLS